MNIWAIPPLITAIFSLFLLLYIFNLDLKSKSNKIFFFIVSICFFWAFSEFNYRSTNSIQIALIWLNISKIRIFILPLITDLIFTFINKNVKNKILFYIIIYGSVFLLYIIDMLNLVRSDVVKNYWGYFYTRPGILFFYLFYIIVSSGITIFNIILSLSYAIKSKKIKDLLFFIALFVPITVGVLTEVILPIIFKIEIPELTITSFIITFIIILFLINRYSLFIPDLKKAINTILLTMSDALFILDRDFNIKVVNNSALKFLHYTEKEVINKNIILFISEKSLRHFNKIVKFSILNDYMVKDEEAYFLTKEDYEIPVSFSSSLIKDKNNSIIGILLIVRDITTRKKLENLLESSNESFINIIEKNIEGIIIADKNGFINYINPIAKKYLNIQGNTIFFKFPYNIDNYYVEEIEINISENQKGVGEFITIPTRWEKEDAFLIIIRDITTRKEIEKNLLRSLREKEHILDEIHHRIKNNLQIVISLLKLPLRFNEKKPFLKSILLDAQSRIKSIALIHEMLYNKRIFFDIDFKEYIEELIKFLSSFFQQGNEILVELNIDNIKFDSDTSISCGLIITELFTNSIKYGFREDQEKKISIIVTKNHNNVILIYKDNGKGLDKEINFNEIKTTGLYLIKLLVFERLKGKLDINSTNGLQYTISFNIEEDYL